LFSKLSNYTLIFFGLVLFFQQMHGYSHDTNPDEFRFSSDSHYHDHLKMQEEEAKRLRVQSNHDSID